MIIGTVLIALVLPATITVECRATSLKEVAATLSEKTGTTYRVEPILAQEVVCISAKDVEVDALVRKISECTYTEWRDDDKGKTLFRPAAVTQTLVSEEADTFLERLSEQLSIRAKDPTWHRTPYDEAQNFVTTLKAFLQNLQTGGIRVDMGMARRETPASILVSRLFADLDPKRLAAIPDMSDAVFSSAPTRAQYPLGPNAAKHIRAFGEAERHLKDVLPPKSSQQFADLLNDVYSSVEQPEIGKVLVRVQRQGRTLSASGQVFDREGKRKTFGYIQSLDIGAANNPTIPSDQKPELSPLSPETVLLRTYLRRSLSEPLPEVGEWKQLPAKFQELFQNPDRNDILSFAATDGCFGLGRAKSVPVVAYLPDPADSVADSSIRHDKIDLAHFQRGLEGQAIEVRFKDGWLTIRPKNPLLTLRQRLSRQALGVYARDAIAKGSIELEALARLHFQAGEALAHGGHSILRMYDQTMISNGIERLPNMAAMGHDALATLGGLSPTEIKRLYAGEGLRIGQMPAAQRLAAERWMRRSPGSLRVDPSANVSELYLDWTEYAPTGLPAQAILSARHGQLSMVDHVFTQRKANGSSVQIPDSSIGYTPAGLARIFASQGQTLQQAMESIKATPFAVFTRRSVTITLNMLPTHSLSASYYGAPVNLKIGTFDQWPEAYRKEFESVFGG